MSGDTAFISGGGAGYVFVRSGTTWGEQQKIVASDGSPLGFAGIDGDLAVATGGQKGPVFVFARSGTTWIEQQKFTSPMPAVNDGFGSTLALSGSVVAVGAPGVGTNSGKGAVFVYDLGGVVGDH